MVTKLPNSLGTLASNYISSQSLTQAQYTIAQVDMQAKIGVMLSLMGHKSPDTDEIFDHRHATLPPADMMTSFCICSLVEMPMTP